MQGDFRMEDLDLNPEQKFYMELRAKKCVMDKKNLPILFTLHENQIVQSTREDGAARDQANNFVNHIKDRMIARPGQKTADPMEASVLYDASEPATHSLAAFTAKMKEDELWTGFKVRVWAHQHLFQAKKEVADYFAGSAMESLFRNHHVFLWVGLEYEEESNMSATHNLCSHDVNNETMVDHLLKIRLSWTKLGCFDSERSNDPIIKGKKTQCFKSIGVDTMKEMNTKHTLWTLGTATNQSFFDNIIAVAKQYAGGFVKDQKLVAGAQGGKKRKGGEAGKKFGEMQNIIPMAFYNEMAWIKKEEDYVNISKFLKNVLDQTWSLNEFSEYLSKYKSMKFLRIQIKNTVSNLFGSIDFF